MVPCRVLGWCGWATIDGLRFVDPDAELRERLSRRTVKSLSMVACVGLGLEGRGTTGWALLVAHFRVGEPLPDTNGAEKACRRYCGIKGAIASTSLVCWVVPGQRCAWAMRSATAIGLVKAAFE